MSVIKGLDPQSILSTSIKRTALNILKKKAKKQLCHISITFLPIIYDSLVRKKTTAQDQRQLKIATVQYSCFDNHVKTITSLQRSLNEELDFKFKG